MWSVLRRNRTARNRNCWKVSDFKPIIDTLESRLLLSGFTDDFEGPTLDSFWNKVEASGYITFPSTVQAHSGTQSVQLNSTFNTGQKNIRLHHDFPVPFYGRLSVYMYDTAAGNNNSNYMGITATNHALGDVGGVEGRDYDGGFYYAGGHTGLSTFPRSAGWHQFLVDSIPTSLTVKIDGVVVWTENDGRPFDSVDLFLLGPTGRPASMTFFDDFEFIPYAQSDISPTSLTWNTAQGGVDFSYQITGADLPQATTAALYWATGTTFDDRIGDPVFSTTLEQTVGTYGPVHVSAADLGTPPPEATHLIVVTDPDNLIAETDETNNVLALSLPDIVLDSVTTTDSRSVTVEYDVHREDLAPSIDLGIFRSPTRTFDPDNHRLLASVSVSGDELTLGHHTKPIDVVGGIPPEFGTYHYVVAAADPEDQLPDVTKDNTRAYFRTWVIGAVVPGYGTGLPGWVQKMGTTLSAAGYDTAIELSWAGKTADPKAIIAAARNLATAVIEDSQNLNDLGTNDVIDVHLIGHSRGSVLISLAMLDLLASETIPQLQHGFLKMTLLDPHPANNNFGLNASANPLIRDEQLRKYIDFQTAVHDPGVEIPARVDQVEVFWEQAPYSDFSSLNHEYYLNLWGFDPRVPGWIVIDDPSHTLAVAQDLTSMVLRHGKPIGHSEVHDWYQQNLPGSGGFPFWGGPSDTDEPPITRAFGFAPLVSPATIPAWPAPPGKPSLLVTTAHPIQELDRLLSPAPDMDRFFRLFGDTDSAVTRADLDAFIGTYGKSQGDAGYPWYLDYNSDGTVDYTDWLAFRDRLPPF